MRKLFAILTMLAALMLASVTAFAAPSLVDNAKVLTPQQRQEVLAEPFRAEQLVWGTLGDFVRELLGKDEV